MTSRTVRRPCCSVCDSFIVFMVDSDRVAGMGGNDWRCLNCDARLYKPEKTSTRYCYVHTLEERQQKAQKTNEMFLSIPNVHELKVKSIDLLEYQKLINQGTDEMQVTRELDQWLNHSKDWSDMNDGKGFKSLQEIINRLHRLEHIMGWYIQHPDMPKYEEFADAIKHIQHIKSDRKWSSIMKEVRQ